MYRAILSGRYIPKLTGVQIGWTLDNGAYWNYPFGDITPWSYIGIGYYSGAKNNDNS